MTESSSIVRRALPSAATLAAMAFLSTAAPVQAQTVTLESFDETIQLSGVLLEFDGVTYRVQTLIGEMLIDAARVRCEGDGCPVIEETETEFTISGAGTLSDVLVPALIEGFSATRDADMMMSLDGGNNTRIALNDFNGEEIASITVAATGSTGGFRDLLTGAANLAVTTRPISGPEAQTFERAGLGDLSQPSLENVLALDGLLIVTSQQNPVRALSETNVAQIFSGEITNWSEVGGFDAPINLHIRAPDTGTGFVFDQLVMRPNESAVSEGATIHNSDAEVSDAVTRDANGIGFSSYSNERNAKSLAIRGVCGIQTPANAFTIKTEEYPLTRRLYVYRPEGGLPAPASGFLDYIRTAEAQQVIADTGFVDQDVSALSINEQGLRFVSAVLPSDVEVTLEDLQGMMQELVASDRLSITYRFESGTSQLDSRGQADIIRLAQLISEGVLDRKEVMFVGFTDSVGRADLNAQLSGLRASQVRDALVAALPEGDRDRVTFNVAGFGEMSPLGCNDTPSGRRINRRVEVWIRDVVAQ